MLDYRMKVSEELTVDDMMQSLYDLMNDGRQFLGDLLDRLDNFNESAAEIAEGLHNVAYALRWMNDTMAQQNATVANCYLKEVVPSSPLSSPLKEGEESSKEEEEIIPPIIPPSPSQENCTQKRAREEMAKLKSSFDEFWQAYGYKRNKAKAWSAWKNLSKRDREAALAGIEPYKADCDRYQRQMCHAVTYLNQRRWEDDFNSGNENADRANGRTRIYTREDIRNIERQQRLEGLARVAADFRAGNL